MQSNRCSAIDAIDKAKFTSQALVWHFEIRSLIGEDFHTCESDVRPFIFHVDTLFDDIEVIYSLCRMA